MYSRTDLMLALKHKVNQMSDTDLAKLVHFCALIGTPLDTYKVEHAVYAVIPPKLLTPAVKLHIHSYALATITLVTGQYDMYDQGIGA